MRLKNKVQVLLGVLLVLLSIGGFGANLHLESNKFSKQDSVLALELSKGSISKIKVDSTTIQAIELLVHQAFEQHNLKKLNVLTDKLYQYAIQSNTVELIAHSANNMGCMHAMQQDIELAYQFFTQAIQIDSANAWFHALSVNKLNLAELKIQLGDFSSAYDNLNDIEHYFEFTKDSVRLIYTELLKVQILYELNRDKSALLAIKRVLVDFPKNQEKFAELNYPLNLVLAENHLNLHQFDSVNYYLNQAAQVKISPALEWLKPYENYLNFQYKLGVENASISKSDLQEVEKKLQLWPISNWSLKAYTDLLAYYKKNSTLEKQLQLLEIKNEHALQLLSLTHKTKLIDKENFCRLKHNNASAQELPITKNYLDLVLLAIAIILTGATSYFVIRKTTTKQEKLTSIINEKLQYQTKSTNDLTSAFNLKNRVIVLISNEVSAMIQETQNALNIIKAKSNDVFVNEVIMHDLNNSLGVHKTQLLGLAAWVKNNLNSKHISLRKTDLSLAFSEVLSALNYDLNKRSIAVHNQLPEQFTVLGDFEAYKIIAFNLLQFIVKQCVNGAEITISGGPKNGKTYITLQDNGFGLSPMQLENVFALEQKGNKHEQIDNLNLLIAKDLAHLMNAELSVDSVELKGIKLQIEINA